MACLFFPGATPFSRREGRNRCLWREESFMLHLLRATVSPWLSLRKCIENWSEISLRLRETRRKRILQTERLEEQAAFLS